MRASVAAVASTDDSFRLRMRSETVVRDAKCKSEDMAMLLRDRRPKREARPEPSCRRRSGPAGRGAPRRRRSLPGRLAASLGRSGGRRLSEGAIRFASAPRPKAEPWLRSIEGLGLDPKPAIGVRRGQRIIQASVDEARRELRDVAGAAARREECAPSSCIRGGRPPRSGMVSSAARSTSPSGDL